jgi:hypothetical protein
MKTLIGLAVALSQKPIVTIAIIINKSEFFIMHIIAVVKNFIKSKNGKVRIIKGVRNTWSPCWHLSQ